MARPQSPVAVCRHSTSATGIQRTQETTHAFMSWTASKAIFLDPKQTLFFQVLKMSSQSCLIYLVTKCVRESGDQNIWRRSVVWAVGLYWYRMCCGLLLCWDFSLPDSQWHCSALLGWNERVPAVTLPAYWAHPATVTSASVNSHPLHKLSHQQILFR